MRPWRAMNVVLPLSEEMIDSDRLIKCASLTSLSDLSDTECTFGGLGAVVSHEVLPRLSRVDEVGAQGRK